MDPFERWALASQLRVTISLRRERDALRKWKELSSLDRVSSKNCVQCVAALEIGCLSLPTPLLEEDCKYDDDDDDDDDGPRLDFATVV